MSICDKCIYPGHCLLECCSVPAKCSMFHEQVDPRKGAPKEKKK